MCGWKWPSSEEGGLQQVWEKHVSAMGRSCKYVSARPRGQPLAQYVEQRDIISIQQLLLVRIVMRFTVFLEYISLFIHLETWQATSSSHAATRHDRTEAYSE